MASDSTLSAAQVRFVAVSSGAPAVDFYVNGTGAAYGLGFESFTSYLPVSAGAATVTTNRAGGGQTLATVQGSLTGGHQYTAVLSHGLGAVQEHVYEDQTTPAPAGKIAVRVLNEVGGAGSVSVYVTPLTASSATPVDSFSVAAGAASGYADLAAGGNYTVTATIAEGGLNLPVASVTVKGGSGAVRTVVFAGVLVPGTHTGVVGFTLDDADAP